jgi:hypothetical protein
MEWSHGEDRMLSVLEKLLKPERTIEYYCCCFKKRSPYNE